MVSKDLLDLLVCPDTMQPVRLAGEEVLARLNERIRSGDVRTQGGAEVKDPLDSGLIREDGQVLYPIRDDIPIMLVDEAIPLEK